MSSPSKWRGDRMEESWWRGRMTVCASILALASFSCAAESEQGPPNVFVVVVDTLRADRVDVSNDGKKSATRLTPFLDSLAETSTVFHRAYSTSAWTSPAVASLFTSRYAIQHGVLGFDSVLADPELTLAEILSKRGYESGGFSSNVLIGRGRGFQQGFDFFREEGTRPIAGLRHSERSVQTARRALAWIDDRQPDSVAPVFVYLHVIDPHVPYAPDRVAMARVFGEGPRPDTGRVNRTMQKHLETGIDDTTRSDVRALYDAEVSSTDAGLEYFFSELAKRALLDNSIVVVTSDHGEELWDHGMFGHHHSLYDEVIRVPLMIRGSGQKRRHDVFEAVSLLDIAPTLIEMLRAKPVEAFEGRSLLPVIEDGEGDAPSAVVSELLLIPGFRRTPHERTVIVGDTQLIRHFDGVERFIDLSADATEDASGLSETEKQTLRDGLDAFIERYTDPANPTHGARERIEIDEKGREELRALGYIE